jgi:hypothetical protein
MFLIPLYYRLKPLIPRCLQIEVRRQVVLWKRARYSHVWPIHEKAKKAPENWSGWPGEKRFALVLTHDVETGRGQGNCAAVAGLEEAFGFRSSFNFVAKQYNVSSELRQSLLNKSFEVGVHGLYHDGNLYCSEKKFREQIDAINSYLKEWGSVGFRAPCMYHNLDWTHHLDIEYDSSTFDTDPYEPQSDGMGTIFPIWVQDGRKGKGFVELPYTLPQDFTLFVLMKERNIDIWKKKLDWIVENRGMALLITHPDYMNRREGKCKMEEYPIKFYEKFLDYVKGKYKGQYWNPLPKEIARFWKESMSPLARSA